MIDAPPPNLQEPLWINPIGGYGDMLMVSGVIKQIKDRDQTRRFNLVRRSMYRSIFQNHPAIENIGYPPPGSHIIGTDYWKHELGSNENRPYQILSRIFGLPTPAEEILYYPGSMDIDPLLEKTIPWGQKNVAIAAGSDSPRKTMSLGRWRFLIERLKGDGFFVIQTGRLREDYIRNSYSLLGLTSPGELIGIIKRVDMVITIDSFAMHAAHLVKTPGIVLWGPTAPGIFGYPAQHHLRGSRQCEKPEKCLSAETSKNYAMPCPLGENHCIELISLEDIHKIVHEILKSTRGNQDCRISKD
jgi:ADP-heptose:LPS heptosyltransferase